MNEQELFPLQSEQPQSKDLKRLLSEYTRYWYLFFLSVLLCVAGAYFYLRYLAVPQYQVFSTLLIKDDKSGQGLTNADAFSDLSTFKSARNIDNETQVLKSQGLMARVVNELGIFTTYYVAGKFKDREIYGREVPIKLLIDTLKATAAGQTFTINLKGSNTFDLVEADGKSTSYVSGQQIRKPYGTFVIVDTTKRNAANSSIIVRFDGVSEVAKHYNQAVIIQPTTTEASVLTISLVDPIQAKAKDIVNKLIEVYNREAIEDKNVMASNTLKFLDERLSYITSDLSGVEKIAAKYKSTNGLTDISTQASSYTDQASKYNQQLSEWAIQIDLLNSIENYLRKPDGETTTVPSTLGIKDETLLSLIRRFNELQLEKERLLRTVQPGSDIIQNINETLAKSRSGILENLRNVKKGLQITSNNLRASSGQFQSKIQQVPGMERELIEINRQQLIKQNIYSYLLQKREETALSLAATVSAARVIDTATGNDFPISPNNNLLYLMAALLGLGLPFAGIYVSSVLNNKVQTQLDVTSITGTPVIGEIAHNDTGRNMVVTSDNRSPIAEMFRLVRANLHFQAIGKDNLVLMVTSSMSGEGKTFFSINFGASLAITGKRVVLVDLDLRDPKVALQLQMPKAPGVSDYLASNTLAIGDILHASEETPDLFIVSAGSIPQNPAELLMSPKLAHLLFELKEKFDYIIIDTPPIGQVADAFTLSAFTDFSIYIVRYNYTLKAQLNIIKNIFLNKTLNRPLIVLNDAKEMNGNNYGYGYGYGYDSKTNKKKRVAR